MYSTLILTSPRYLSVVFVFALIKEEAKGLKTKATKHLETSVFKWKPDHLAAAPAFEKAAECYRAAKELEEAKLMYTEASNSHEMCNSFAASGIALGKGKFHGGV